MSSFTTLILPAFVHARKVDLITTFPFGVLSSHPTITVYAMQSSRNPTSDVMPYLFVIHPNTAQEHGGVRFNMKAEVRLDSFFSTCTSLQSLNPAIRDAFARRAANLAKADEEDREEAEREREENNRDVEMGMGDDERNKN